MILLRLTRRKSCHPPRRVASPSAGDDALHIIEVNDQEKKSRLAETCDHQPFYRRLSYLCSS